jgi:hypothetical protein
MFKLTVSTMAILLSSVCSAYTTISFPVDPRIGTNVWEEKKDRVSALYVISSKGDYIGAGKTKSYVEGQDGKFIISKNYHNGLTISLVESKEYWSLKFSAAGKQNLTPGIYKNASRFSLNTEGSPGLDFSGNGRGCNTLKGEFEILEIEYDDDGNVNVFAANFIQKCGITGSPLFGSIRINSAIPAEVRFSEIFNKSQETILYLLRHDPETYMSQPILLTAESTKFSIQDLPYGGEGVEVVVESDDEGSWTFDFAVPFDEQFEPGYYQPAYRYPFHSSAYAGIDILTPEGGFTQPKGGFDVLRVTRGEQGKITSLALDFKVTNEKGEVLEGALRFNSKVPFDLESPY